MGWHGPRGSCGCCNTFACDDCDAVTYFSISGLTDPSGCTGGCTKYEGTYVFRTIGSQISDCAWQCLLASENCGLDDSPQIYIGVLPTIIGGCGGTGIYATVFFASDPGGVKITLQIELHYQLKYFTAPVTYDSRRYLYTFEGVFAACSDAIGATLALTGTSASFCAGGDPGDLCGVNSAIVSLG
mgnify:CR=1 FL=1